MKMLYVAFLTVGLSAAAAAAEMQGVVVDWECVKPMVQNGREKTLKDNNKCSLMKNYRRSAYGLITDEHKYYRLEDPGNGKILQLLKGNPTRDNTRVVVTGDLEGNTLKISTISML